MALSADDLKRLIRWLAKRVPQGTPNELLIEMANYGYQLATSERDPDVLEGRKLSVEWSRQSASGIEEDRMICTFHFVNFTNGEIDTTWTDADFLVVETAFDVFWTLAKTYNQPHVVLDRYRWHRFGPGLPVSAKGNEMPGPAVRHVERNVPGTAASGSSSVPPQVAITVTERVIPRKLWGRIFLPFTMPGLFDQYGRVKQAEQTTLMNWIEPFYESCITGEIMPVVYSRELPTRTAADGSTLPARQARAHPIQKLQLDDVADIQRRRRHASPQLRVQRELGPA